MNEYVILERQEEKVIKLEKERKVLSNDIFKAKSMKELDETEKRIKSLRKKRDYLCGKIEENYEKSLGPKATMKAYDLLERLDKLLVKRKCSSSNRKGKR